MSTLIINLHPQPLNYKNLPEVTSIDDAKSLMQNNSYEKVIIFCQHPLDDQQKQNWIQHHEHFKNKKVCYWQTDLNKSNKASASSLQWLINTVQAHPILINTKKKEAQKSILNFIESRVPTESKFNKTQTTFKVFTSLQRAHSTGEMESLLLQHLGQQFQLAGVRILFSEQSQIEQAMETQSSMHVHTFELSNYQKLLGRVVFIRETHKPFTKSQLNELKEIVTTVSLSVERFINLETAEILKTQWESIFNAIQDAICLTDKDYNIIHFNESFAHLQSGLKPLTGRQIHGLHCYDVVFNYRPYSDAVLKQNQYTLLHRPRAATDSKIIEIKCQTLNSHNEGPPLRLLIFRDVTEQHKLERQVLESGKMAELGTISSSIAHELNNPLAGVLSYLQLILMDLSPSHSSFEDIKQMETSAMQCKEIVENLLGFSRIQDDEESSKFKLQDIIENALMLCNLQIKSMNIAVHTEPEQLQLEGHGQFNLLIQAFKNILQNSIDSLIDKLEQDQSFEAQIRIETQLKKNSVEITITDNGQGIPPEHMSKIFNPLFTTKNQSQRPGLGLTVAFNIIEQHGGQLEIYSQPLIGTSARIALSRSRFIG